MSQYPPDVLYVRKCAYECPLYEHQRGACQHPDVQRTPGFGDKSPPPNCPLRNAALMLVLCEDGHDRLPSAFLLREDTPCDD